MRSVKISITKARIKNVFITYSNKDSKLPRVNAGIELLTENGESITTYDIDSEHYQEDKKFDIPARLIEPMKSILMEMEKIVVKHCNERTKLLNATEVIPKVDLWVKQKKSC